jgi:hypothetical protein
MAKFWLINTVLVAGIRQFPGEEIDSTIDNIVSLTSAGAVLWPQGNAVVDAAAHSAVSARVNRGASEVELEFIMQSAVDQVQLNSQGGLSVANEAALNALNTSDLADGSAVYVKTYRQYFEVLTASLALIAGFITTSDNPSRVWIRRMTASSWSRQFVWAYNKDTGTLEGDGTAASPILSLDEISRRLRVLSAGANGVQQQYTIQLQTDTAPGDTWFPSALVQADGVQIGIKIGELIMQPTIVGFRRTLAVPGGSGALTANSALVSVATRAKATLVDANANFTTLVGQLVMVADTASAPAGSGAAGSIGSVASGVVTFTGGTGFTTGSVNRLITITGSATSANNGTFPITEFVSATSVKYSNPSAVAPDVNNGAISWTEKAAKRADIANAPNFTNGSGVTVTAVSAGIATLAGAPASTFTAASVGARIRMAGGIAANNGDFTITAFISDTSVQVANVNAAVDATVQTFQGVCEVGPTWYDEATLAETAAAPLSGSPYVVVRRATVTQRSWGAGQPTGIAVAFTDCELTAAVGLIAGGESRLTSCRLTGVGGFIAGAAASGTQSFNFGTLCTWVNVVPGFGSITCQENGYNRFFDSMTIGYNIDFREAGTFFLFSNSMIQGGYFGCAATAAVATRPASALGVNVAGPRGLGVFNNVQNSATNPPVSSGSQGAACIFGRNFRAIHAGATAPQGQGRIWGVGALLGIHLKEGSTYMTGAFAQPNVTDTAGQAGFPVREVKVDGDAPLPVPSATTGVPTAIVTTSGVAATFTQASGIVTVVDAGAAFTAASVGRTLTFIGQNNAANNGTFVVESFVGGTSVRIRNPAGVTDAVAAGSWTENPVVTQWGQAYAAPYSGNFFNYVNGTRLVRVAEV